MTTTSPSKSLRTWDAARQAAYRQQAGQGTLHFTFLLDASPSMLGQYADNLRTAFNRYLAWLKAHAGPMSLVEVHCFSTEITRGAAQPLSLVAPLTSQTYDPRQGDGTALYRALGETCTHLDAQGQRILVVFTDGMDNRSDAFGWTVSAVQTLLTTLQAERQLLAVFLGAFDEALEVAATLGFAPGNTLMFSSDQIPDAFKKLTTATQRYLATAPAARKALATGGIF